MILLYETKYRFCKLNEITPASRFFESEKISCVMITDSDFENITEEHFVSHIYSNLLSESDLMITVFKSARPFNIRSVINDLEEHVSKGYKR